MNNPHLISILQPSSAIFMVLHLLRISSVCKPSSVSKHKTNESGFFCERTSRPFSQKFVRNYQDVWDKYTVSTKQIKQNGLEVNILGADLG